MNAGTDHAPSLAEQASGLAREIKDLPGGPPLDDPKDNELGGLPEPVCEECGMSMDDEEARIYGGHSGDCQRVWIVTEWNEETSI